MFMGCFLRGRIRRTRKEGGNAARPVVFSRGLSDGKWVGMQAVFLRGEAEEGGSPGCVFKGRVRWRRNNGWEYWSYVRGEGEMEKRKWVGMLVVFSRGG